LFLDHCCGLGKSSEDLANVASWLHGDNSELILFVNPDEESLVVIVEDTSAFWPFSVESTGFKESVSLFEEEVVVNELLLVSLRHSSKAVVFSLELTFEFLSGSNNVVLNFVSFLLAHSWAKRVVSHVSGDSDSSRDDHLVFVLWEGWALKVVEVHIEDVLVVLLVTMVGLNDWVQ